MYQDKKAVLIFGVGPLQQSIINRAKKMGLYTIGIDPCKDATCRDDVDAFEVVGGQDYEGTCSVVEKYGIDAIVTAATDKPLVMMALIAEKYGFPFFSVDTAVWSTDKFLMKERFELGGIPHAQGRLISKIEEADGLFFPVIVKPRDNSGSRGVKLCRSREELQGCLTEALENSKMETVLVEEFIDGPEYSIEGLHFDGKSEVIQFTEKKTTEFPYNVELAHKQPANLTNDQMDAIRELVVMIGDALRFDNCPSHTELKINERGIFVIETSPRLGGDYITSTLVPLSTGINMEDDLIKIALGKKNLLPGTRVDFASAVIFFNFPEGTIIHIDPDFFKIRFMPGVYKFDFKLREGDIVNKITSSLNRYGEIIVQGKNLYELDRIIDTLQRRISILIKVR